MVNFNFKIMYIYIKMIQKKIPKIFTDCFELLRILNKTKETYLYKYLIRLFNDKKRCHEYVRLWEYFESNRYNIISYKQKIIKRDYLEMFKLLVSIVNWGREYYYEFY